jgi:hypothetical protein
LSGSRASSNGLNILSLSRYSYKIFFFFLNDEKMMRGEEEIITRDNFREMKVKEI